MRKTEHIENYLKSEYQGDTLFQDVLLGHNALPELNYDEIDTRVSFLGKDLAFPLMINSMTGGGSISYDINESLAAIGKKYGLAMATGSQQIGLEDHETIESFKIAREVLGEDLPLVGNLSADRPMEEVVQAKEMIGADAIQLHLNPAQELVMDVGDRNFRGILENITFLHENLDFPLIVKEVGFGVGREQGDLLYSAGVRYLDLAGAGGTNFIEIEDLRYPEYDFSDLYDWGHPTAYLVESYKDRPEDFYLISSGGIKTALDIVKSLVMGADLVGISGEVLNYLVRGEESYAMAYIENLIHKTKILMLLLGVSSVKELRKVDYKIVGRLREMLDS